MIGLIEHLGQIFRMRTSKIGFKKTLDVLCNIEKEYNYFF